MTQADYYIQIGVDIIAGTGGDFSQLYFFDPNQNLVYAGFSTRNNGINPHQGLATCTFIFTAQGGDMLNLKGLASNSSMSAPNVTINIIKL